MVQTERRSLPLTLVVSDPPPSVVAQEVSATDLLGAAAVGFVSAWTNAAIIASPHEAVAAAEEVSSSRAILYQCLIDLGWTPPIGVVEGMRLDARLTHEGIGGCYEGLPAYTPGLLATATVFFGDLSSSAVPGFDA